MAKEKVQKKPKTKTASTPRKKPVNKIGFIALAILVLLFGLKVYIHQQDINKQSAQQRVQYDKVDAQMQGVMAQITTAVGKPDEVHYGHGCAKTAAKFDEGQMTCSISYRFFYQANSIIEAKRLTHGILMPVQRVAKSPSSTPTDPNETTDYLSYYSGIDSPGVGCSLSYSAMTQEVHNETLGPKYYEKPTNSAYAAEYVYSCGGPVVKALYPIR